MAAEDEEVPEEDTLEWDLQERDRWLAEHPDEMPDPAITIVGADE